MIDWSINWLFLGKFQIKLVNGVNFTIFKDSADSLVWIWLV